MIEASFPSVEELRRRASAKVDRLRPLVTSGATLVALEVSGIQRFIFNVPTDKAGLEVKARSFWVALLPKILSWRARNEAELGLESEVLVAAGRAVLLVPSDRLELVHAALGRDAHMLREETADDLAVAFASRALPQGALDVHGEGAFEAVYGALIGHDLANARWRRAQGVSPEFWTPGAPPERAWAPLGRMLRTSGGRISTLGISCASAGADLPLGISIKVGAAMNALAGPRLLLRTDGNDPAFTTSPGDEVAALPLAGTWIKGAGEVPLDFDGLAERSEGDPKLGVLRMDLDALGSAFRSATQGKTGEDALRDRLALSEAVSLACGPFADRVTWSGQGPRDVQWILAGGDDLFLVGAWSEVIDLSLALQAAIVPPLASVVTALGGEAAGKAVNLSGGIVITQPSVPIAHLADQAEDEVLRAKGKRSTRTGEPRTKGAISWGGIAMGWRDWKLVAELGRELGEAIRNKQVSRSLLRRLGGIHTLWHRAEAALLSGAAREAASANKRRWLWTYELDRASAGLVGEGAKLVQRISKLALMDVLETEQEAGAWLGVVAEIAHRRTRAGREERT